MAIATYDQIRAQAGVAGAGVVKLARERSQKDLFLSHSKADEAFLPGAIGLLHAHGANVYVDVADPALKRGDPTLAERLRLAVQSCKRLVVLATENTSTSRWIPWEMGLADGSAGPTQVAVLPMRASASASELWARQEYFNLYARIEADAGPGQNSPPTWQVRNPLTGKSMLLRQWLAATRR